MSQNQKITYKDFRVFNKDGSKKSGIIKAYLTRFELIKSDLDKSTIKINEDYLSLIVHPQAKELISLNGHADCVISIQFRNSGHYAIAELHRDDKPDNSAKKSNQHQRKN